MWLEFECSQKSNIFLNTGGLVNKYFLILSRNIINYGFSLVDFNPQKEVINCFNSETAVNTGLGFEH